MKGRGLKLLMSGVALLCLGLTAQAALLEIRSFCAHLNGVDSSGNLNWCKGTDTTFTALVNTLNGLAVGTATGCVDNCSNLPQVYVNGCFGRIRCVCVSTSVYVVLPSGKAVLAAIGQLCSDGKSPPT